jgi:hypothetical protein
MAIQEIIAQLTHLTATNGTDVVMDFLLTRDSVLDGLCPLAAIAAGDERQSRVLRLLPAEDSDGFSSPRLSQMGYSAGRSPRDQSADR